MSVETMSAAPVTSASPHAAAAGGDHAEQQGVGAFATILAQEIVDERNAPVRAV